jgi:hypothetical protein
LVFGSVALLAGVVILVMLASAPAGPGSHSDAQPQQTPATRGEAPSESAESQGARSRDADPTESDSRAARAPAGAPQPGEPPSPEELRKKMANAIVGLARGATPHGESPIDVILAEPYWNPRNVTFDRLEREALWKVLSDGAADYARSHTNYLATLSKVAEGALSEGRYEVLSPDTPPAVTSTGGSGNVVHWFGEKDGKTVRVSLDPAKSPEFREALTALDATAATLHDAVQGYLLSHGTLPK